MTDEEIRIVKMQVDAIVKMQVDAIAEPVTLLALLLLYVHRKDVK